jgi:phosphate starvation-inducible protein PhoH and related proteins
MSRKKAQSSEFKNSLNLKTIEPLNNAQNSLFEAFYDGYNIISMGTAGTGKSFLSIFLGLEAVFDPQLSLHKVLICRSCVPSRDIGFLPGTEEEKIAVYKRPYVSIVNELFRRDDAWEILEKKGIVEFCSTSFLRGTTIDHTVLFVDEIQNLGFNELHSVVTRLGKNSALVMAGDFFQMDLDQDESGLKDFFEISKKMNGFKTIHFQETDIVRSDFIREYIIAKNAYEREKSQRKIFNGHTVHRTSINTVQLKGKEFVVEHSPVN